MGHGGEFAPGARPAGVFGVARALSKLADVAVMMRDWLQCQVEIIANDQGNRITPSYVAFDGRLPSLCHATPPSVRVFLWRFTPYIHTHLHTRTTLHTHTTPVRRHSRCASAKCTSVQRLHVHTHLNTHAQKS